MIAVFAFLGGHLGRDKTCQKITAQFYCKTLWTDVKQYIHQCETWQCTNDVKFQKITVTSEDDCHFTLFPSSLKYGIKYIHLAHESCMFHVVN